MTRVLATFSVVSRETKQVRQLSLIEGLSAENLTFVASEWSPRLKAVTDREVIAFQGLPEGERTQQVWEGKLSELGAQDWEWDWEDKAKNKFAGSGYRVLGIVDGESVEALMVLNLSWPSRLEAVTAALSVYVEYVAVAPWNRRQISPTPRFGGLGKVLLNVAVTISMEEGMQGRCGLHSLRQAEGFYKRIGMQDLGFDDTEQLNYFEFSPDSAKRFLET